LVARCSAGAVNHVPIARGDPTDLATRLKEIGVCLIGTDRSAETPIEDCNLTLPTALVVGNENSGISQRLKELCDSLARVPQQGRIGSLNAAVAAGIAFYEAARQRIHRRRPGDLERQGVSGG
ncbi:MAG: TrmH family RNA methyltransferase, partial [Planctomycetaceae bacterium]